MPQVPVSRVSEMAIFGCYRMAIMLQSIASCTPQVSQAPIFVGPEGAMRYDIMPLQVILHMCTWEELSSAQHHKLRLPYVCCTCTDAAVGQTS